MTANDDTPSTAFPEVERLHAATVHPGDIIVATIPDTTPPRRAEEIKEALRKRFPDNEVMVVTSNVVLDVYSPDVP